jgi:hypothetical protein
MLLVIAICASSLRAASDKELKQLEAEMLKYIETKEHDKFFEITDKLKEASREAGNERMFYEAWTNQCIYEASQ